jgi:NADH:ubiquinone oxidoreductase subunit 6 (subunit J)
MELSQILFWILAVLTGISAIGVVVTQNIVRAAAFLLFTLGGVAAIFFLLGADFVGATQLIVYVGGTLVLVVFGVMLTAQGPFINMRAGAAEWAIATVVGVVFFGVLAITLYFGVPQTKTPTTQEEGKTESPTVGAGGGGAAVAATSQTATTPITLSPSIVVGEALLGIEDASPRGTSNKPKTLTNMPGRPRVRTPVAYLLPFEIVSVHLLVVLIGAAYLARAKRRRGAVS